MPSRMDSNGSTGLHCTGRPDQKGASLGLSGDSFAETAAVMAAVIASSGPTGPVLAIQFALGVASWFPIRVEFVDTPGQPHGAKGGQVQTLSTTRTRLSQTGASSFLKFKFGAQRYAR